MALISFQDSHTQAFQAHMDPAVLIQHIHIDFPNSSVWFGLEFSQTRIPVEGTCSQDLHVVNRKWHIRFALLAFHQPDYSLQSCVDHARMQHVEIARMSDYGGQPEP